MATVFITGFPGPAGVLDRTWRQFPVTTEELVTAMATRSRDKGLLLRVTFPGAGSPTYVAATYGLSTLPGDTPPNRYIPGKFSGDVNYGVTLFSGIEPTLGTGGIGVLELTDPDGELDSLINSGWDGAAVDIMRGANLAPFATYTVVATAIGAGLLYDQRKKYVRLRDFAWKLEQAPLHDQIYGGAGGVDGDAALAGQDKPYLVGAVFNVSPVLINATLLIYQVSCSSIRSVLNLRDGGVQLGAAGDVANYATLAAASLTPGTYMTCLSLGLIRLASPVVYSLAGDFEGDNDTISSQPFPSTRGQIARRIAIGRGTQKLTDAQIDTADLNTFEAQQPGICGFYWPSQPTKAEALNEVLAGCLGYWAVRLNGLMTIGSLRAPSGTPAVQLIYPEDFGRGEPRMSQTFQAPRQATYIGYGRNYSRLSLNQIAGSIQNTSAAAAYQQDTRWASSLNPGIATTWPTAPTVRVAGGFVNQADAQSEAVRQQLLMQTRRERWQVEFYIDPYTDYLGKVVQITNFTRFGWGGSRLFLCVGMSFASGLSVTLDLWG